MFEQSASKRRLAHISSFNKYDWSGHKGYLSGATKWGWLYKNYILSFFSKNVAESIRRYKRFVSKETLEEINQVFGGRNLPAVIECCDLSDKAPPK